MAGKDSINLIPFEKIPRKLKRIKDLFNPIFGAKEPPSKQPTLIPIIPAMVSMVILLSMLL